MEKSVLLIDDDKFTNSFHKKMIENINSDVAVETIDSGEEALSYFRTISANSTSLKGKTIFLDLVMDNVGGFDVLTELEELSMEDSEDLKIYILTSQNTVKTVEQYGKFPFVKGLIWKPLEEIRIRQILNEYA